MLCKKSTIFLNEVDMLIFGSITIVGFQEKDTKCWTGGDFVAFFYSVCCEIRDKKEHIHVQA